MNEAPTISPPPDPDSAYRQYLADLILQFASKGGALEVTEANRQVMAVTHRTLTTVKNWLSYRVNFPDVASLARIVNRWEIPPEDVFPPGLDMLLSGVSLEQHPDPRALPNDEAIVSMHTSNDPGRLDRLLLKYTDHPRSCVYVRQEGSDMLDQIRPGELMLVDPSCEQIRGNGLYLLKFSAEDEPDRIVARNVDLLLGEPAARLSCGSAMLTAGVELLPMSKGSLPSNVSVLGRIIAVLKQT